MMIKKNEKGFALVLSLILLMVMSLMGGSLVVISSSDHKGNNSSDEYQQAFYAAEAGLLEGEKDLIKFFMGHSVTVQDEDGNNISQKSPSTGVAPSNSVSADTSTPCYKSFKNITLHGSAPEEKLQVVKHIKNLSFYELIEPIINQLDATEADSEQKAREIEILENYTYEYFIVNIGKAPYKETGSSIAAMSVDVVNEGSAYRIYGCGIYKDDDVIIPLESVMVLPG